MLERKKRAAERKTAKKKNLERTKFKINKKTK